MDWPFILELVGYVASVLVAVSLTMTSIIKLRVINLLGAVCFVIYGMLIAAYPVALVNFVIVWINVYNLFKIYTQKEYFEILEISGQSKYLDYFINHFRKEIENFTPGFEIEADNDRLRFIILRNAVPAGVFIGELAGENILNVKLDYVIPGYRDFKIGKFLFAEKKSFFTSKNIQKIVSAPHTKKHSDYLKKMGFAKSEENLFKLELV